LQQQVISALKTKLQTTEAALQSVEEANTELRNSIRSSDGRASEMSDLLQATKHKLQLAETELALLQKVHEETRHRLRHVSEEAVKKEAEAAKEAVKVEKLSKELTFVRRDLDDAERKIFRFEKESWQDRSLRDCAFAFASCNLDTCRSKSEKRKQISGPEVLPSSCS
jgi:chromosome segregation ATPase